MHGGAATDGRTACAGRPGRLRPPPPPAGSSKRSATPPPAERFCFCPPCLQEPLASARGTGALHSPTPLHPRAASVSERSAPPRTPRTRQGLDAGTRRARRERSTAEGNRGGRAWTRIGADQDPGQLETQRTQRAQRKASRQEERQCAQASSDRRLRALPPLSFSAFVLLCALCASVVNCLDALTRVPRVHPPPTQIELRPHQGHPGFGAILRGSPPQTSRPSPVQPPDARGQRTATQGARTAHGECPRHTARHPPTHTPTRPRGHV
jgi:hypothetical protein